MKTYVLTVSKTFPKTHKRAGEPTFFKDKIILDRAFGNGKIHTIRSNYQYWKNIVEKIQAGEAILSIRYWSGKPYKSKQVEICQLDKDSGVGVQELDMSAFKRVGLPFINFRDESGVGSKHINALELSDNDGLSYDDFKEWFKDYDMSKPMAVIHFTKFRY